MPLRLRTHERIADDLKALPTRTLRVRALRLIKALLERPFLGGALDYRAGTGNLGDCRKLYFDDRPDVTPRYRIVYRVEPGEDVPAAIHIIAVGRRERLQAYESAVARLGRG